MQRTAGNKHFVGQILYPHIFGGRHQFPRNIQKPGLSIQCIIVVHYRRTKHKLCIKVIKCLPVHNNERITFVPLCLQLGPYFFQFTSYLRHFRLNRPRTDRQLFPQLVCRQRVVASCQLIDDIIDSYFHPLPPSYA